MKGEKNMFRQGDVLLVKINKIPKGAKQQEKKDLTVFAYGEKTGHMHAIRSENVVEYQKENERYFEFLEEVCLSHGLKTEIEEKVKTGKDHSFIEIPAGKYKLITQREYTPEKIRRVAD